MSPFVARPEGKPRTRAWGVLPASLTVCVSMLLCGCAALGPAVAQPAALHPSADRGRFHALRSCAGCHAVGNVGASPDAHAPPFRDLEQRVAPGDLARRLGELSAEGHREMPPIYMTPDEIRDLRAYLRTLKRASPPGREVRANLS